MVYLAHISLGEDAWVYGTAWQTQLRQAATDIAEGHVRSFDGEDDFLAHLERLG